jgi:hypothetical protein
MVKFSNLFHTFSTFFQVFHLKLEKWWKSFENFTTFSVKNVWKTNNIFYRKLCWKIWISQPVWGCESTQVRMNR